MRHGKFEECLGNFKWGYDIVNKKQIFPTFDIIVVSLWHFKHTEIPRMKKIRSFYFFEILEGNPRNLSYV